MRAYFEERLGFRWVVGPDIGRAIARKHQQSLASGVVSGSQNFALTNARRGPILLSPFRLVDQRICEIRHVTSEAFMTIVIQLRRDTAARWAAANPVLASGEPGLESDTGRIKFGDGTTAWSALAYFLGHVDDTPDAAKPVSSAQAGAIAARQPLDSDLAAIAALSPQDGDLLQCKSGEWSNRTPAQVKLDFALTRADVGLALVDDTADVDKPVSIAQSALVAGAVNDHRADPGAHPQYVPYSVYSAAIANLQSQIDALTAGGSAPANVTLP